MFFSKFWILPDNPPIETDCFVVLSYAVKSRFSPNNPTKRVIELAYEWWKKNTNAYLVMSTGDNQNLGVPNSKVMADYAVKLGVKKTKIVEEDKSLNTYENLFFSEKIIKENGFNKITLVTLDLHSRRAVSIAEKLGWKNFNHVSCYAKGESSFGKKYLQTRSRLTIFIYEVLAYVYNYLLGQL